MFVVGVCYAHFVFFFLVYCVHRDLHVLTHSFPARRSSDLVSAISTILARRWSANGSTVAGGPARRSNCSAPPAACVISPPDPSPPPQAVNEPPHHPRAMRRFCFMMRSRNIIAIYGTIEDNNRVADNTVTSRPFAFAEKPFPHSAFSP